MSEGYEGEIIKRAGDWILTRENVEGLRYKPPKYFYRVYYLEQGRWVRSEQGNYSRCLDHFTYQSQQEMGGNPTVIHERRRPPLCPRCRENDVMTTMRDMGSHYHCMRCGKVVWKRKI